MPLPPRVTLFQRVARRLQRPDARLALTFAQLAACLLFIVLYVWGTYSPAAPGSPRFTADVVLGLLFAADYASRILKSGSPLHAAAQPLNLIDLLSFAPTLLEAAAGCELPWDLRWCRIFRCVPNPMLVACFFFRLPHGWL